MGSGIEGGLLYLSVEFQRFLLVYVGFDTKSIVELASYWNRRMLDTTHRMVSYSLVLLLILTTYIEILYTVRYRGFQKVQN